MVQYHNMVEASDMWKRHYLFRERMDPEVRISNCDGRSIALYIILKASMGVSSLLSLHVVMDYSASVGKFCYGTTSPDDVQMCLGVFGLMLPFG